MATATEAIVRPKDGNRGRIALLSAAHFTNDAYSYYLPVLLPVLIANLDISLTLAGLLVTIYNLTSSVVQPLFGYLVDQADRRWFSYAGLAVAAIANASLVVVPSYPLLFLAVALAGLGTATFHPAATAMAVYAAGNRKGTLMSFYLTAGNIGLAAGPVIVGAMMSLGQPKLVPLLAIPALVICGLIWRDLPPSRSTLGLKAATPSLIGAFRSGGWSMFKVMVVVTFRSIVAVALTSFLPVLFAMRGQGRELGAAVLSIYLLFGAIGGMVGGTLSDRYGRIPVIVWSLLLAPPAVWLMINASGPLLWAGAALAGALVNGSFIVLTVKAQELMPRAVGVASGLMLGLSLGMGGMATAPIAALGDVWGLQGVLNVLVFAPWICAAVAMTIDRRKESGARGQGTGMGAHL